MYRQVSARKYAKCHQIHPNTVYRWIRRGLIYCTAQKCTKRTRYYIRLTEPGPDLHPGPVDQITAQAAALAAGCRSLRALSESLRPPVPADAAPAASALPDQGPVCR